MKRFLSLLAVLCWALGAQAQTIVPSPSAVTASSSTVLSNKTLAAPVLTGGLTTTDNSAVNIGSGALTSGAHAATSLTLNGGAALTTYTAATAWTPTDASGAGLAFASTSGSYTRIGNMIFAYASVVYPATADGSSAAIGGFPVSVPNAEYARQCIMSGSTSANGKIIIPTKATTTAAILTASLGAVTNAQMSGATIYFNCIYPAQ